MLSLLTAAVRLLVCLVFAAAVLVPSARAQCGTNPYPTITPPSVPTGPSSFCLSGSCPAYRDCIEDAKDAFRGEVADAATYATGWWDQACTELEDCYEDVDNASTLCKALCWPPLDPTCFAACDATANTDGNACLATFHSQKVMTAALYDALLDAATDHFWEAVEDCCGLCVSLAGAPLRPAIEWRVAQFEATHRSSSLFPAVAL